MATRHAILRLTAGNPLAAGFETAADAADAADVYRADDGTLDLLRVAYDDATGLVTGFDGLIQTTPIPA